MKITALQKYPRYKNIPLKYSRGCLIKKKKKEIDLTALQTAYIYRIR